MQAHAVGKAGTSDATTEPTGLRCLPVQATGTWFVGKRAPVAGFAAGGGWQVSFVAYDKIKSRLPGVPPRLEPWHFTWTGEHAHQWWRAHGAQVQAGAALRIHAERMRCHVQADRAAEIHAEVVYLELETRARVLAAQAMASEAMRPEARDALRAVAAGAHASSTQAHAG